MTGSSRFCSQCGTPLGGAAAFCPQCGARAGGPGPAPGWIAAGVVIAVSALVISWLLVRGPTAGGPVPATAAPGFSGPAPDLGAMTARESFDRLYNRVMMAAEQGDATTARRFAAHGLAAYAQLEAVDSDARYHAAVLHAELGQFAEALAQADTILAEAPGHLLAWVIRGAVAESQGDAGALAEARQGFAAAWAADPRRDRPEYDDHRRALDDFRATAGIP